MNTGLITRYTGALYNAPEACRPRYDEFRDMFSEGQLKSKIWLTEELQKQTNFSNKKIAIVGSWFATLAFLILENAKKSNVKIKCIDIDDRCSEFIRYLIKEDELETVQGLTADMREYSYSEDIVINTGCEHLANLGEWLALIPPETLLVLQSNNFFSHPSHVNCAPSLADFSAQLGSQVATTLFQGELNLGVYTRYMIIGVKS